MPVCPSCGHDNTFGALICSQCYALLIDKGLGQSSETLPPAEEVEDEVPRTRPVLSNDLLTPPAVALFINRSLEPVIVQIPTQAILGRSTPQGSAQQKIDLTPYGAFERGVSRVHAVIRRTEKGMSVEDLASSNGTWLNGVRLQPYIANALKSGDHLQLGHMHLEILFSDKGKDASATPST